MATSFHRPTIVGRERERQFLRDALDRTMAGQGMLVLLSGEAGIGKTTLVDDLTSHAREHGVLVLAGACYDLMTTPPYGPWAEAIRGYRQAGNLPEIPAWFGNLDELEKLGSQTAIFEAARSFFSSIAVHQPLMIVLEDLHWTDPASVDALRYMSRSIRDVPVFILATCRDDEPYPNEPLQAALPVLVREARAERLELRRWPETNTRALIASRYRLGAADEERLASHTHRMAEGNPFYTVELLRMLESDETLRPQAGGWALDELGALPVPSLVRQVIERRLAGLSIGTRALLQVAAVIGHDVPFDLWEEISGAENDQLASTFDAAIQAQLVDELPDRSGIRFRHALVRETLYAQSGGLRLRDWHRKAAESLIRYSASADKIAHHFSVAGDERAVGWLIRAGFQAQQSSAWISAVDRFCKAEDQLAQRGVHTSIRGWLLYYVSTLQRFTNDSRILPYLDRAENLARELNDPVLLAYIIHRRGDQHTLRGNIRRGIALIKEAIQLFEGFEAGYLPPSNVQARLMLAEGLPGVDGQLVAPISSEEQERIVFLGLKVHGFLGVLSNWQGLSGDYHQGLLTGQDWHYRMVSAFGEDFHLHIDSGFMGYFGLGHSNAGLGKPRAAQTAYQHARVSAEMFRDFVMASYSAVLELIWVAVPYFADDLELRRRLVNYSVDAWAQATEMASIAGGTIQSEIIVDVLEGRWPRARGIVEDELNRLGPLSTVGVFCFLLGYLARHTGEVDIAWQQIQHKLPEGYRTDPGNSFFPEALSLLRLAIDLSLDTADLLAAREWLEAHDRWLDWSGAVLGQAEGHLLWARYHLVSGDRREARKRAEQAFERASDPRQPLALIAARRFLGELDTRTRAYDAASNHLTAAAQFAEACQAPYEIALTRLARAELAQATGDNLQALALLNDARRTFEQLEARPALVRAERLAALLESHALPYPAGLTGREVEVLCLIAGGKSNRQIATDLYLSVRTVERHVTNIYAKINVTNRVDAAAFVREHQLGAWHRE